jgi:hypothetical protein
MIEPALQASDSCGYEFSTKDVAEGSSSPFCELSRSSTAPFLSAGGGGRYPNLLQYQNPGVSAEDPAVRDFLSPHPARQDEIRGHFDRLKQLMAEKIKAGRPVEKLNPTELFLLKKLEALPLRFIYETEHISLEERMQKCTKPTHFPDVRVASIGDGVELKCGAENLPMPAIVLALAHEIGHVVDLCALTMKSTKKSYQLLGEFSSIRAPADFTGYPFKETTACLSKFYGKAKRFQAFANNFIPEQLAREQSSSGLCSSVMKEHFADLQGGALLNEYYKEWRPEENEAATATMYMDRDQCLNNYPNFSVAEKPETRPAAYPAPGERLRSYLSQPRVAESLHCGLQSVQPLCP